MPSAPEATVARNSTELPKSPTSPSTPPSDAEANDVEPSPEHAGILSAAIESVGFAASDAQIQQLIRHAELIEQGADFMNLTAVRSIANVLTRLTVPSIQLLAPAGGWLPTAEWWSGRRAVDVGTGAGFPGIPLAILNPDTRFTLIEARRRKCEWLTETVRELDLPNVDVRHGRAESFGRDPEHRERYDIAMARAVARLGELAELVLPLLQVGGVALLPKGGKPAALEAEVAAASPALERLGSAPAIVAPAADASDATGKDAAAHTAAVVYLMKIHRVPDAYPRNPGMPRKRPLA